MKTFNKNNIGRRSLLLLIVAWLGIVCSFAQDMIQGVVVDEAGEPLVGVTVKPKVGNGGTITDLDGVFMLPKMKNKVYVFSFIGYKTMEVRLTTQKGQRVVMLPDNKTLNEVVVVGYGNMKRSDITGAITSVNEQKIRNFKTGSVVETLGGQMAGVQVTASDGTPGTGFDIKIRGVGTVNGDSSPLYIVDGFEVSNIDYLANSDIASIDVLKDASASAIYGARAANGVVLVKTKSGQQGRPVVAYNGAFSLRNITKHLDLLTPREFVDLQMEINPLKYAGTYFKEGKDVKKNVKNGVFDYVVAGFRVAKHVGVSFGVIPYTNIGYSYATTGDLNSRQSAFHQTYSNTFEGKGGLHQVYLGAGWQPFNGLAIGANIGYLWGNYTRSVINSYSDAYVNTISKYYSATINNYKLDVGLQYTARFSKKDDLTIGLTYGLGHKLGTDPECSIISNNSQTNVADTTSLKIKNGLELPHSYGAGLMFNHNNKWNIGVDYSLMQFGKVGYPEYTVENGFSKYALSKQIYKDRHKFSVGAEFCPNENGRKFVDRIFYRIGASYATPYYKVNGVDGPKECWLWYTNY